MTNPPLWYSSHAAAAWRKGFAARMKALSPNAPYVQRSMQQAWIAGWDAANREELERVEAADAARRS